MIHLAMTSTEINTFLIAAGVTALVVILVRTLYKRSGGDQES